MLKYDSFRSVLKYGLFKRYPNNFKKRYIFLPQYKNEWKEHECWGQKDQKK